MALFLASSRCAHCGADIALRRYAPPRPAPAGVDHVDLWTVAGGAYPGDQSICTANIGADDQYGRHDPIDPRHEETRP